MYLSLTEVMMICFPDCKRWVQSIQHGSHQHGQDSITDDRNTAKFKRCAGYSFQGENSDRSLSNQSVVNGEYLYLWPEIVSRSLHRRRLSRDLDCFRILFIAFSWGNINLLVQGSSDEIQDLLPIELATMENSLEDCLKYAKDTETTFEQVKISPNERYLSNHYSQ